MKYSDFIAYLSLLVSKIKLFLKKILALICDEDFDLDIYRVIGIASYSAAITIALKIVSIASSIDSVKLGLVVGLVTALSGIGAKMFDIALNGDRNRLASKASKDE